ncbi:hypothetical protein [Tomitella cavernea]|uniref:DUF3558 domain-containing protein n=1 Tax=Tomitella cavernea TaxID=1387982 RepID=A0ABP9CPX9_9ACTN|nr:hypothetical protein [Tomitella cavernea]
MSGRAGKAAAIAALAGLLAGCSGTEHTDTQTPYTTEAGIPATGFFDPCDAAMTAWFGQRGYHHPDFIEPILDEIGSNCSYTSDTDGFAVMSRGSTPGDGIDRRLHHLLGIQGPVSQATLAGYPIDIEIISSGRQRQDCHLVATVGYGFLEVSGGPRGPIAETFPRDCDAAQTFTANLLRRMDHVWPG